MFVWNKLERKGSCKFNSMIECSDECRQCRKCGWNPDVSRKRKIDLRTRFAKEQAAGAYNFTV